MFLNPASYSRGEIAVHFYRALPGYRGGGGGGGNGVANDWCITL